MKAVMIYIRNILRTITHLVFAVFAGRMFPIIDTRPADKSYINLTPEILDTISKAVVDRMISEGVTHLKFYMDDFFDCVEFARCFCDYFAQEARRSKHAVIGKGCPIAVLGFNEKKRGGHACVAIVVNGELGYYEPYPEHFRKLDLDKEEIASMKPILF